MGFHSVNGTPDGYPAKGGCATTPRGPAGCAPQIQPHPAKTLIQRLPPPRQFAVPSGQSAIPTTPQVLCRACVLAGIPGEYVTIDQTVRGFQEILDGKHDHLPEQAFYMKGTIDQVVKEGERMRSS